MEWEIREEAGGFPLIRFPNSQVTRFLLEEARGGMEDPRRGRWVPLISAAFHLADIEPRPAVAIVTQGLAKELVS